ncbi:MAG: exodeoxyribonuclease III [Anaerolineae bacterium]|nr:exodeoxyribonuclease III [Anaerolineae bacterium]
MLRLYSWNVNGIRAAQSKGLLAWIHATQPDVLCLQETKAHPDQIDEALRDPDGYHSYWAWSSVKKGYSGVALYSKIAPRKVQIGLGIPEYDQEGRTIVADYGDFVLIGAYFPNGARDHSRVPFKMAYKAAFLDYTERLRAEGRSVIFCGDVNTAHRPIDLARPDENENTTGFLPEERAWLDEVVAHGYVDIFRDLHPDEPGHYTYWNYWGNARPRNIGWRIDYFFITPDLRPRIAAAEIHADVPGSDHCPISLMLHS